MNKKDLAQPTAVPTHVDTDRVAKVSHHDVLQTGESRTDFETAPTKPGHVADAKGPLAGDNTTGAGSSSGNSSAGKSATEK